jgi:mannose-6-phosphate isomerase-like protein (cupin superfamily)
MIRRLGLLALISILGACKDPPPAPPAATSSAPSAASSAPPPPPPSPIAAALPDVAPPPLDRRAECSKEGCQLPFVVPDEVRPALSDGAPAVIWEEVIGERATLVFPRDEVVELLGVVLDGTLDLTPMESAPNAVPVGPRWSAFRAPGGGVTLNGAARKPVRVALVVVATEPGTGLGAHLDQRDKPGAPPSWNWKTRPGKIDTFSFLDKPDLAWGGGAYHARLGLDGADKPAAALELLRMSPSAGVAEHAHDRAWEILAMLEGEGALVRKAPGGDERIPGRAGSLFSVPPTQNHAWTPSGKTPFLAIQVYTPPGPEQRYKKLSGK